MNHLFRRIRPTTTVPFEDTIKAEILSDMGISSESEPGDSGTGVEEQQDVNSIIRGYRMEDLFRFIKPITTLVAFDETIKTEILSDDDDDEVLSDVAMDDLFETHTIIHTDIKMEDFLETGGILPVKTNLSQSRKHKNQEYIHVFKDGRVPRVHLERCNVADSLVMSDSMEVGQGIRNSNGYGRLSQDNHHHVEIHTNAEAAAEGSVGCKKASSSDGIIENNKNQTASDEAQHPPAPTETQSDTPTPKRKGRKIDGRRRPKVIHRCSECGRKYPHISLLERHVIIHTGERSYQCDTCGLTFTRKDRLKTHIMLHTGERPFPCNTCGKAFIMRSALHEHQRVHTGVKPYKCQICGWAFAGGGGLLQHMRTHTGEKPFPCTVCGKAFTIKCAMTRHMRIHTNEMPYECTMCGRQFNALSNLKAHVRLHTGEKPFKCITCGNAFAQKYSLISHIRTHTGEKPFKCERCGRTFANRGSLREHLQTLTKVKKLARICGKQFSGRQQVPQPVLYKKFDNS